jgi:hypothetical protein
MIDDARIIELLEACDGDCSAVGMALVDEDVSSGKYEGCSTDLELAFAQYEARAVELLDRVAR